MIIMKCSPVNFVKMSFAIKHDVSLHTRFPLDVAGTADVLPATKSVVFEVT